MYTALTVPIWFFRFRILLSFSESHVTILWLILQLWGTINYIWGRVEDLVIPAAGTGTQFLKFLWFQYLYVIGLVVKTTILDFPFTFFVCASISFIAETMKPGDSNVCIILFRAKLVLLSGLGRVYRRNKVIIGSPFTLKTIRAEFFCFGVKPYTHSLTSSPRHLRNFKRRTN